MPRRLLSATLAAALLVPAAGAGASTVDLFSSLWVFGDSLSDTGNLYAATDGTNPPDPPYHQGRRSNGPLWSDHIAGDFEARGLEHQNFAFAFGQAVTNDDVALGRPGQIPDLAQQIESFRQASPGRLGSRPLATILIGANDILTSLEIDPGGTVGAGVAAANAVADGIRELRSLGVENYLVFTLPPIDKAPALLGSPGVPLVAAATELYNATLAAVPGVRTVDLHAAMLDLLADPAKYGIENVSEPCVVGAPPVSRCTPEEADLFAFYDGVHPNQVVHAGIADLVRAQVAPVPLPLPAALLVAGIAGLVLVRRKARA